MLPRYVIPGIYEVHAYTLYSVAADSVARLVPGIRTGIQALLYLVGAIDSVVGRTTVFVVVLSALYPTSAVHPMSVQILPS